MVYISKLVDIERYLTWCLIQSVISQRNPVSYFSITKTYNFPVTKANGKYHFALFFLSIQMSKLDNNGYVAVISSLACSEIRSKGMLRVCCTVKLLMV